MKPRREYQHYLRDMLDARQKAERFNTGLTYEVLEPNDDKAFAVIRARMLAELP